MKNKLMRSLTAAFFLLALWLDAGCRPQTSARLLVFVRSDCPTVRHSLKPLRKVLARYPSVTCEMIVVDKDADQFIEQPGMAKRTGFQCLGADLADAGLARRVSVVDGRDGAQAKRYGISISPTFCLLDASGNLVYHGSITERPQEGSRQNFVWEALEALRRGKPVPRDSHPSFGCQVALP
jgi:hypothetical protein